MVNFGTLYALPKNFESGTIGSIYFGFTAARHCSGSLLSRRRNPIRGDLSVPALVTRRSVVSLPAGIAVYVTPIESSSRE